MTRRGTRGRRHHDPAARERVVGGLHPVRELLRAGHPVHRVLVARSRDASPVLTEIRELAAAAGVAVEELDRDRLDADAGGLAHQGVVALAPPFPYTTVDTALDGVEIPLLVALDGVTDPHNLGSIARTAEAVGADGLLVPSRRSVGVTPAAEKAAAGALAHLPVIEVTNLARALGELSGRGIWSVGLDADADLEVADCRLFDQPLVLVVGAEGRGLARLTAATCDQTVRLPMRGRVGSLNASVAAAVALYEVLRRRAAG